MSNERSLAQNLALAFGVLFLGVGVLGAGLGARPGTPTGSDPDVGLVVFPVQTSAPARSGPRSFLAAILTRARLRVVMPRLPLAPVLARSSLRSSLAVVFGRS